MPRSHRNGHETSRKASAVGRYYRKQLRRVGEGGCALLEVGADGFDLVGAAAQFAERPGLFEELLGQVVLSRAVEEPFGAADGVGALARDVPGEFDGGGVRGVGGAGGQTEAD